MASEPVLSREVGNLTSRVVQSVMVISAIVRTRHFKGEGSELGGEQQRIRRKLKVKFSFLLQDRDKRRNL